ncbi:hypothetical protein BC374_27540 [Ensifer sp. LC13]|nr:hypothetical protein BC362_28125 [Ensifer sp. LC14]OCP02645.1 hypothetical protein BBX50_27530 [Ensifer sp. LC11]OCP02979.1 hypothetical protein BC374_27540 [Ensifer sp. LC13]OCP29910.1 hypothetical protein BC364_27645 [Ensifer sp. LC499]
MEWSQATRLPPLAALHPADLSSALLFVRCEPLRIAILTSFALMVFEQLARKADTQYLGGG